MRNRITITVLALIVSPAAAAAGDIPMVGIGLPYAPETPTPLAATHPLYQRIDVVDIEGLPSIVKSTSLNWIGAAKRSSVNKALRDSLNDMHMLAPDATAARVRLTARWVGSHTPIRIATRNRASVTLHYRLVRIDNGQELFNREITTSVEGGGVEASMRDNGIARAAIATNFASAANCLDRAAFGSAPADCALVPKFSVSVERRR